MVASFESDSSLDGFAKRRFEEAMARYCGAKAAANAAVSDDLIDQLTEELEPHFQKLRRTPPPDLESFSLKVRIFADLQGDPHGDLAFIINDIEHLKG